MGTIHSSSRRTQGSLWLFLTLAVGICPLWEGQVQAAAFATPCELVFRDSPFTPEAYQAAAQWGELRVGTYNVFNLTDPTARSSRTPENQTDFTSKPLKQVQGIAETLLEAKLDIAVIQEVSSREVLETFSRRFLQDQYDVWLTPGNDARGIQVGFLVKKGLPFDVIQRTHKEETWIDPTQPEAGPQPVFSRDLAVLEFRAKGQDQDSVPLFLLFGSHFKSQRSRDGDPSSNRLRLEQATRTASITQRYWMEYGREIPILFGADFNDSVNSAPEFLPLWKVAHFEDSLSLAASKPLLKDRISHTFHLSKWITIFHQLDGILVSSSAGRSVQDAGVIRYKDAEGQVKPLPTSFNERKKNPSDHFLVYTVLNTAQLLEAHPSRPFTP